MKNNPEMLPTECRHCGAKDKAYCTYNTTPDGCLHPTRTQPSVQVVGDDREARAICELFYKAQVAFDHGDDVAQMLYFGEATERNRARAITTGEKGK